MLEVTDPVKEKLMGGHSLDYSTVPSWISISYPTTAVVFVCVFYENSVNLGSLTISRFIFPGTLDATAAHGPVLQPQEQELTAELITESKQLQSEKFTEASAGETHERGDADTPADRNSE